MNQHINQELMWKNQRLIQSAVNGISFDDKAYHGSEKLDCDRSLSNSSFNRFNTKLTPIPKVKEYKNYNEVESGTFADPIYIQNNNDTSMPKLRNNAEQHVSDEYLWFYLDPRNNVQGPFHDSQMFQWWSQGIYFQNSLYMKRKCDADFSTLQDYSKRFNGVPFGRKDVRVPPLAESMSTQSPKMHPHRTDPNYILQLLSTTQNHQSDDFNKGMSSKVGISQQQSQRIPPHMGYDQSQIGAGGQNGVSDRFLNTVQQSNLSNFVNLSLSNPAPQSQPYTNEAQKQGPLAGYQKVDRYHQGGGGGGWGPHSQPKLSDSVWTSTSDDTILSSNPVWSRSNNDAAGPDSSSLMHSIFHDNHSAILSGTNQKPSNMQETWDNLDPAIIKIVSQCDSSNNDHTVVSLADTKLLKPTESSADHQKQYSTFSNVPGQQQDNTKYPWAELVRKGSTGNQKSKSGFNSEHETTTNHSISPNRHKGSLTSSSSDEYEQPGCEQSTDRDLEALVKWATGHLENKPGTNFVDIATLIEVLIYVESPYEVEATMRENVPDFDSISEFVKVFIEKRRPLRQKLFAENPKKHSKSAAAASRVDDDNRWQVKSKSHGSSCKKKKSRNNNTKN